MSGRSSPAFERNKEPILGVLGELLPGRATVLEVASGSGQHAVYLAARLPALTWQPSDADPSNLPSIAAWIAATGVTNVLEPIVLDVRVWPESLETGQDAVVAVNLLHVAPWEVCLALLDGAAHTLRPGGLLYLYGPYKVGGRHTAPSNQAFDEDLRRRNPAWGVRDLDEIALEAQRRKLRLERTIAMPANNLSVVFTKGS